MPKKKRKQSEMSGRPEPRIEKTESKEVVCFDYGVFGLDSVDCDILRGFETEEQRNKYLKKRFPEGI